MDTKVFTAAEITNYRLSILNANRSSPHLDSILEQSARQAEELERVRKQEHVGWCRYQTHEGYRTSFKACDSDAPGAFKVYRLPAAIERSKT